MSILTIISFGLFYMLAMILFGLHCVDYAIWAVTGQDIHFIGDFILALFFGPFFVPAAILLWLVGFLGLAYPLMM